jgi:hypothetical protein
MALLPASVAAMIRVVTNTPRGGFIEEATVGETVRETDCLTVRA